MLINLLKNLKSVTKDEKGQGMVEYALIIGGIAIVVMAIFATLSGSLTAAFQAISDAL